MEEEIDDLEGLELEQIQRFEKIVEQKVVNVKNSMQIIDNSRKILFLTAPEIHWHANVWYMERFHLSEDRLNPSNPVQRLSFIEVTKIVIQLIFIYLTNGFFFLKIFQKSFYLI